MTRIADKVCEMEEMAQRFGLSVDELCRRAEIDRATWTRWKSGAVVPRLDSWLRIEAVIAAEAV